MEKIFSSLERTRLAARAVSEARVLETANWEGFITPGKNCTPGERWVGKGFLKQKGILFLTQCSKFWESMLWKSEIQKCFEQMHGP